MSSRTGGLSRWTPTTSLPTNAVLVRTTPTFDEQTVPPALLNEHKTADGVWGRLIVHSGTLTFVFEDAAERPIPVADADCVVIPPGRLHHLIVEQQVSFAIEFHRVPTG